MVEDDLDYEDDPIMQKYQEQRLQEMKAAAYQHKFPFGMMEINKQDYETQTKNLPEGS